jgi:hypothetical protein
MQRPTRTLTTTHGHEIVLNAFMTGGEFEQVQDVFLKKMEIGRIEREAGKESATVSGLPASTATESNHIAIKFMVVSVDGSDEDVLGKVLALPVPDYRDVLAAIEEATADKKK